MLTSLEVEVKAIERAIFAQYEPLFNTCERDSAVRAARNRAVVSAVAECARGRGWLGVILVRDNAYLWAMAAARDQISARAIERGRGRAALLREFAAILFNAIDHSGLTVSSVDRYWFVASAIHTLLLHPWWSAQYGKLNHTAYFKHYTAQSTQTVTRLRAAEQYARLVAHHQNRGAVSYPGCELPAYANQ